MGNPSEQFVAKGRRPYYKPWYAGEGKLIWLPKIDKVRVPHKVLNAVVFLGARDPEDRSREEFIGTGFIVALEEGGITFPYIVTARHVAEKLERAQEPTARLNDAEGVGHHYALAKPVRYEVKGQMRETVAWYRHPDDPNVDVAVTAFVPSEPWLNGPAPYKTLPNLPLRMFVTEDMLDPIRGPIGIGDEVFLTGLFAHVKGRESNSPICRVGNLAMLPNEAINIGLPEGFADVYLIEAKSMGALSGSPVFVRGSHQLPAARSLVSTPKGFGHRIEPETVVSSADYLLLGLAHGHWNIPKEDVDAVKPLLGEKGELNVGIAVVVPAFKILETLNQPKLAAQREDTVRNLTKEGPTARDSGEFTRDDFMRDLKKVVGAKPPSADQGKSRGRSASKKSGT